MADGQDDAQVRIGAYIDPSGADAGASKVVEDVDKIKDASAEAGEGINNSLDNRRAITHALRGLMELREGGTMALAGLASEGFVATEAFEAMLGPLAPFLMTLTLLASIGIPMFERMAQKTGETAAKEDDLKDATNRVKESVDATAAATKTWLQNAMSDMQSYLALQSQIIEGEKTWAQYINARTKAQEENLDATTKLTIAQMEQKKQQELAASDGSPEARRAIEAKYAAQEAGVKGASADEKHRLELEALNAQHQSELNQRDSLHDEDRNNLGQIDDLNKAASDAAQRVRDLGGGLGPDADGSFKGAMQRQQQEVAKAIEVYNQSKDRNDPAANQTAFQQEMIDQQHRLGVIEDAQKARDNADQQIPKLQESIEKNHDALDKLDTSLDSFNDILAKNISDYLAQKTTDQTEANKAADDGKQQAAKDAVEKQIAELEVQKKAAESGATPNKAKADEIDAQIAQLKLNNANVLGLSQPERIGLGGDVTNDGLKENSAADKADNAALKKRVEDLEKQIHALTNNPDILRASQTIAAEFNANPIQAVAQMNTELALAVKAGFAQVRKENESTRRIVDSIRNSQGSSN